MQPGMSRRENKHNESHGEETVMTTTPTHPPTMARPHAPAGRARQDGLAAPDPVGGTQAAHPPAIEVQRERAQQELKRIWDLCTPAQ